MPDLDVLFPGRFLKGKTLAAPKVIRMKSVDAVVFDGDEDDHAAAKKKETKGIVKYVGADGPGEWLINKTNALLVAAMFGRDFATWTDHCVTIYFDPNVKFGREKPGGIRVFGSPEIAAPLRCEINRPRRKTPEVYVLTPTDKNGNPKQGGSTGAKSPKCTRDANDHEDGSPCAAGDCYMRPPVK